MSREANLPCDASACDTESQVIHLTEPGYEAEQALPVKRYLSHLKDFRQRVQAGQSIEQASLLLSPEWYGAAPEVQRWSCSCRTSL